MLFARLFKISVFIVFSLNLVLLLAAISSPWVNPMYVWFPALLGLFFKVFFLVHVFFVLTFLIGRLKKLVWLSGIVLILCFPALIHTTGFWFFGPGKKNPESLKILTYNVNNFDFYHDSLNPKLILKVINNENPDIICFQEYFIKPSQRNHMVVNLQKAGYKYYYEYITDNIKTVGRVGQAIFSKLPFSNMQPIPFINTSNGAFSVDMHIKNDTFRVYNVHLQSISLRDHEVKIPVSLEDFRPPQKYYYRMLFVKLKTAFEMRSFQALKVKESVAKSPYKVILCGDFNDTPLSFAYHQLTDKLDDSFLRTGLGIGSTFGGKIPLQRIDYVLTSPEIKTSENRVIHTNGSDHFPVVCSFSLH